MLARPSITNKFILHIECRFFSAREVVYAVALNNAYTLSAVDERPHIWEMASQFREGTALTDRPLVLIIEGGTTAVTLQ